MRVANMAYPAGAHLNGGLPGAGCGGPSQGAKAVVHLCRRPIDQNGGNCEGGAFVVAPCALSLYVPAQEQQGQGLQGWPAPLRLGQIRLAGAANAAPLAVHSPSRRQRRPPSTAMDKAAMALSMAPTLHYDRFAQAVQRILSKQPYMTALPRHGHLVVVSLVAFTLLSWLFQFVLGPRLLRLAPPGVVKSREATVTKWGHQAASTIHAVMVSLWALYLYQDRTMAATLHQRVFGYSPALGNLFAVLLGYFIWDFFCCAWNYSLYGNGFLIHSLLGIVAISSAFKPLMMYPTCGFIFFEVSTIFINLHWIVEKVRCVPPLCCPLRLCCCAIAL